MKKKELKELAQKIAKQERIIQDNEDAVAIKVAQEEIIRLTGRINSLEDLSLLDDMIQQILTK